MLCVTLQSYTAPCAATTGGVSDIWVYDPSDFNWTQDNTTKSYTAVAQRVGAETGKMYLLKFERKEAEFKFKQSKNFNNQSFETTKEQYSILDSSNPKFKILRLFRQNFKMRWTRDFPINSKLSNVNFTFKDNAFYVSFNISYESNLLSECNKQSIACKKKISNDIKSIGMDINIDSIDLGNKLIHKVFNIKDITL